MHIWNPSDGLLGQHQPHSTLSACRYAELIYNGFWFSPERQALQALIDETQKFVNGTVRLKLYKVGRLAMPVWLQASMLDDLQSLPAVVGVFSMLLDVLKNAGCLT